MSLNISSDLLSNLTEVLFEGQRAKRGDDWSELSGGLEQMLHL